MDRYSTAKNKLNKVWDQSELNTTDIKNEDIKKLEVKFTSTTALKSPTIITVVEDYLISATGVKQIELTLLNFPDWAVNFAQSSIVFNFDSVYDISKEVDNFYTSFVEGTLEVGDISIVRWLNTRWWTKEDGLWRFNMKFDINFRVVTAVSEGGFSTDFIPTNVDVDLHILNERVYNEIQ